MTDFTDAQAKLQASVAGNVVYLASQDDAALSKVFAEVDRIQAAVSEWVRALVSLQALTVASEKDFDASINAEALQSLRQDVAKLAEHVAQLRTLIVAFSVRARLAQG